MEQIAPRLLPDEMTVRYTEQELTEEQKAQARENIGACESEAVVVGRKYAASWNGSFVGVKDDIDAGMGGGFVLVYDALPSIADMVEYGIDYAYQIESRDPVYVHFEYSDLEESNGVMCPQNDRFVIVYDDGVGKEVEVMGYTLTFNYPGLYFYYGLVGKYDDSIKTTYFATGPVVKTINPDFLPSTLLLAESQTLTEAQKAQVRKNIGTDFSYNFATVNKTSTNISDFNALKYIETNWGKEPMNISVQGFPVVKLDATNKRFCTFYTDKAMHVFKWETNDTNSSSKVTWVSKQQLADTGYVDEKVDELSDYVLVAPDGADTLNCDYSKPVSILDPDDSSYWSYPFYLQSKCVLTQDDVVNGITTTLMSDGELSTYTCNDIQFNEDGFAEIMPAQFFSGPIYIIPEDNYVASIGFGSSALFPKKGIWIDDEHIVSITVPGYTGFKEKVVNPEIIPESVATKTYVDEQIGNIESVLDSIISIQNSLIGGESE
jgi:hypothetical protein